MSSGKVLFLWLKNLPHKCREPPPCHLITYSASMYHCTQRWPKNIWPKKLAKLYLAPGLNFIKSDLEYKTNLFSSKCAFCMWLWLFYSPPPQYLIAMRILFLHTRIVFVTGEYQELNEKSSLQEGVIKLLLREGVKTLKPWVTFFLSI